MATVVVSGVLYVTAELLSHMHDLRDTARATLANTAGRIANYEAQAQRQPKTCPQGTETSRSGTAARNKLKTYRCCSDRRKIRHAAANNCTTRLVVQWRALPVLRGTRSMCVSLVVVLLV